MVWILGLGYGGLYHRRGNCGNMANSRKKRREISKRRAEGLLLLPCRRCYGDKPRPPTRHRYHAPRPGALQRRILEHLEAYPFGGTYHDVARGMGYARSSPARPPAAVVKALRRLQERGLVERHVRRTANGHLAYLWLPAGVTPPREVIA